MTKIQTQLRELEQCLAHTTAEKSDIDQLAKLKAQEKQEYQQLAEMMDEEARNLAEKTKQQEQQLAELEQTFTQHIADLQHPSTVLTRGYAIIRTSHPASKDLASKDLASHDSALNTVMTSIAQVQPNTTITIELQDGYLQATVNAKHPKN